VLFYTHVTDRFTLFHGPLDQESELGIGEHTTDTARAVDHVFGM